MARIPFLLNARKLKQWQMVDWSPPRHISRHGSPPPTVDRTVVHFIVPQLQQQIDIRHQNCLLEEHRGLSKDTNRTQELATTKACVNITRHKLDTAIYNCINTCLGMQDEHMKRQHTCVLVCETEHTELGQRQMVQCSENNFMEARRSLLLTRKK